MSKLDASFFQLHRQALMNEVKSGVISLSAYGRMQLSHDAAGEFLQEANFWYLTGINEPDWWMIIDANSGTEWLVMADIADVHKIFDGTLSADEATRQSGIRKVLTHDEGITLLRTLTKKHALAYTVDHQVSADQVNFTLNPSMRFHKERLERVFSQVVDCTKTLAKLRAIKSVVEISALERAIHRTVDGFKAMEAALPSLQHEYQCQAEFDYHFHRNGDTHAYTPIVAGGAQACTLHYTANNQPLKKRSFVLCDVGARVDGYAADITRTYAIGQPTKRQQAVHQAVCEAQAKIISLITPYYSFEQYQTDVTNIMFEALQSLGLAAQQSADDIVRRYMPHAVSHGLGIDVHDSLGGYRQFSPGMVITVEPGIYLSEEGIGVRIEDDILVTETGSRNLSKALSTGWQ